MSFENIHEVKERFLFVANELHMQFPDLDLRFNLREGSSQLRFMVGAVSPDIVEIDLDESSVEEIIYAAIFQVKELAQIFDA